MTKEEIFEYFLTNSANLGVKMIILTMVAAFLISAIIYATYYATHKGVTYNKNFNLSLIIVLLISVVIMLMISSNIVISLGMVGALSIVRFRTAIKDSRDTIFIFWAITEGLCTGSLNFRLAIITTLFISIVLLAMTFLPKKNNKYLLVLTGEKLDSTILTDIISKYTVDSKIKVANKSNEFQEIIYEIKTKNELEISLLDELLKVKGMKSANYVVESSENVG